MNYIRFEDPTGTIHWGQALGESQASPLSGPPWLPASAPADGSSAQRRRVKIARLLAPADPPNIFAIGRNYREHANEMRAEAPAGEPLVFQQPTTAIIGPGEAIVLPAAAPDEVDFEAELAVVIGRTARNVPLERAMDHVFGYTCANDVTARDCQKRRDKQWTRAKGFDTFCPLGPVLVPRDRLDAQSVQVRSFLNGNLMQDGNTADMLFSIAELIGYLSRQFTLLPGTLLLTGTPAGVGFARTPQVFLRPGDEIAVEIEGIGPLANPVAGPLRE